MTPDQQRMLEEIIAVYRQSAPTGWLRTVCRWEGELDDDGDPAIAMAHVLITDGSGELLQLQFSQPSGAGFMMEDLHGELARETESGKLSIDLIIDRDGTHVITRTEEPSQMLDGEWDDSSQRVHHYLENNRAELEALSARI